jgi:glutamate-5-semialdehyde dehydrogenase
LRRGAIAECEEPGYLKPGVKRALSGAMLDRVELTDARLERWPPGWKEIARPADPVGEVWPSGASGGFEVGHVRIPMGVIGMI